MSTFRRGPMAALLVVMALMAFAGAAVAGARDSGESRSPGKNIVQTAAAAGLSSGTTCPSSSAERRSPARPYELLEDCSILHPHPSIRQIDNRPRVLP